MAEVLLYAEAKLGEMLEAIKPAGNTLTSSGGRKVTLPEQVTHKQSHYAQQMSKHKEVIAEVVNQTVMTVKNYLDGEFAKSETLSDLPAVLMNLLEQKTEKSFNKTKAGVGQTTILKFLGGNWKKIFFQNFVDD